ncbi:MAG: metal-dependent hydrolase, partial [Syntrophaceae bacterium]|nr:metal-dependent hydrolase [Syntrophaceae bacterium]
SAFTHAFIVVPLGKAFFDRELPPRFWALAVFCSILPDVDVLSFFFRTGFGGLFWHRGFTHSLLFAFLLSLAVVWAGFRDPNPAYPSRWRLWLFLFLLTVSHGALDAMTGRAYGVAFFSPFDPTRYSFPWDPIRIAPIGLKPFFSPWGKEVILSEIRWVWVPSLLVWAGMAGIRWSKSKRLPRLVREIPS